MNNERRRSSGRVLTVQKNALESNEIIAGRNRTAFGKSFVVNFLSSPGSGKTSILEAVIPVLKSKGVNVSVIEGDVETDLDKQRIDRLGVPAYQVVTGGTCHLDAKMVNSSFRSMEAEGSDIIFIENVGNLVCPTSFNLGEDVKAVVLSVTEGDDKPLKYPAAFYKSGILIINKTDLLPYLESDIEKIKHNALSINKELVIFETSARSASFSGTNGNDVNQQVKINSGIDKLAAYFMEKASEKTQSFKKGGILL